jgi:hypothetical protein
MEILLSLSVLLLLLTLTESSPPMESHQFHKVSSQFALVITRTLLQKDLPHSLIRQEV